MIHLWVGGVCGVLESCVSMSRYLSFGELKIQKIQSKEAINAGYDLMRECPRTNSKDHTEKFIGAQIEWEHPLARGVRS